MNKKYILIGFVALSLSFGLGYFATPSKIETKEVVKTVTVKEEAKTKVVYKEKIVYKDGTVVERESEREDTNTRESSEHSRVSEKEVTKNTGLTLAALAIKDVKDLGGETGVQITASKRILGALNVAASVTSYKDEKLVGVGLGWSF